MQRTPQREPQRIAKLLARAGVASRREIERMIAEGRIAIEGQVIETPATLLDSLHGVTVDGAPVSAPEPARLFLFHKPTGVLTTERDPAGRPTIYDRLPRDLPRLIPVGRLDLNTEGLLLLTTDGGFKRQLELPSTGVERTYRARAYGAVSQAQLEELIDGVEIEGMRYGKIDANLERRTGANVWIELTLTEGKNREVRRVLEHLGLSVSRLIRTRYGPFVLGDLPSGEVGEVRQHDLVAFRQTLGKPVALRRAMEQVAATPPSRPRTAAGPREPVRAQPAAARPAAPRKRESREALETHRARPPRSTNAKPNPAAGRPAAPPPAPATAPPKPKRGAGWARAKPKPGRKPRSRPTGPK